MTQDETIQFCKNFVQLLRISPNAPLRSRSEQLLWKVVILGQKIPDYEWHNNLIFTALNCGNNPLCFVHSFVRDNQQLFRKED